MFDPQRFQSDDRDYVREIVAQHGPFVLAVCRAYTRDPDMAQDLMQETWAAVCRGADGFAGSGSFRGWLHRIATNVCRSRVRAERTDRLATRRYLHDSVSTSGPPDPLNEAVRRELHDAIHRAVAELPDGERRVITLRVLQGRPVKEVADLIGVAPATVRSQARHALNRLRTMMEDPDHDLSRYRAAP